MRVLIKENNQYYKDLVGQEFDVVEKFDLLHDRLYYIRGRENETNSNWFRKNDCKILDENYLKSLEILRINEKLNYYNSRLEETKQKLKLYESGEYKERFEGEGNCLLIGSLAQMQQLEGKIDLLENLLGTKELFK